jgi:hypothetical protein
MISISIQRFIYRTVILGDNCVFEKKYWNNLTKLKKREIVLNIIEMPFQIVSLSILTLIQVFLVALLAPLAHLFDLDNRLDIFLHYTYEILFFLWSIWMLLSRFLLGIVYIPITLFLFFSERKTNTSFYFNLIEIIFSSFGLYFSYKKTGSERIIFLIISLFKNFFYEKYLMICYNLSLRYDIEKSDCLSKVDLTKELHYSLLGNQGHITNIQSEGSINLSLFDPLWLRRDIHANEKMSLVNFVWLMLKNNMLLDKEDFNDNASLILNYICPNKKISIILAEKKCTMSERLFKKLIIEECDLKELLSDARLLETNNHIRRCYFLKKMEANEDISKLDCYNYNLIANNSYSTKTLVQMKQDNNVAINKQESVRTSSKINQVDYFNNLTNLDLLAESRSIIHYFSKLGRFDRKKFLVIQKLISNLAGSNHKLTKTKIILSALWFNKYHREKYIQRGEGFEVDKLINPVNINVFYSNLIKDTPVVINEINKKFAIAVKDYVLPKISKKFKKKFDVLYSDFFNGKVTKKEFLDPIKQFLKPEVADKIFEKCLIPDDLNVTNDEVSLFVRPVRISHIINGENLTIKNEIIKKRNEKIKKMRMDKNVYFLNHDEEMIRTYNKNLFEKNHSIFNNGKIFE